MVPNPVRVISRTPDSVRGSVGWSCLPQSHSGVVQLPRKPLQSEDLPMTNRFTDLTNSSNSVELLATVLWQ